MIPPTTFSRSGGTHGSDLTAGGATFSDWTAAARLPRWKRPFDLAFLLATAPLWLPLMAIIMWVIKLVSPGPAFYRQERVGHRGQPFMIFKFRSMKVNAETGTHERYVAQLMEQGAPMIKLDGADPRLIPLGRFLRATGLDELPQIFNILRGEMSLVGPRPCTTVEFARYELWHKARVNAHPGITGFWQVNGKNKTTFNEMIAMDLFYLGHRSIWLDTVIIVRTIPVIFQEVLASVRSRLSSTKAQQFAAGTFRRQVIPLRDDE